MTIFRVCVSVRVSLVNFLISEFTTDIGMFPIDNVVEGLSALVGNGFFPKKAWP